jgi:hypothetical protein
VPTLFINQCGTIEKLGNARGILSSIQLKGQKGADIKEGSRKKIRPMRFAYI